MRQSITTPVFATLAMAMALPFAACAGDGPDTTAEEAQQATEVATGGTGAGAGPAAPAQLEIAEDPALADDRRIFDATMERARRENLQALPIGQRTAAIGKWFVGSAYVPGTLEVTPEHLVINLREFDCVTYVESMLAMARLLDQPTQTFEGFQEELRTLRYRGGVLNGYTSRLHYFSDWILDNQRLGLVRDVTAELGGVPLREPIDFMSTNRDQYAGLATPEAFEQIRVQEQQLSAQPLHYVPKGQIPGIASRIQEGDIIAATSSIDGLDIAHTGLAVRIDGELHLMHAPLVGRNVEISELPLAERIMGISGQDGIMVARPL